MFINIGSFAAISVSIIWKLISKSGVTIIEFLLFRNIFNLIAVSLILLFNKTNPFKNT